MNVIDFIWHYFITLILEEQSLRDLSKYSLFLGLKNGNLRNSLAFILFT
jgi:hypothetical protein